jgi:peptidoglycan hydrolase-like protein with peptidoglycan-binding domain
MPAMPSARIAALLASAITVTLTASGAVLLPSTAQAATCANRGTNPAASTLRSYFDASARKYALPPHLLKVMAYKESTWRQFTSSGYTVVSPGGGIGIMQLTGATAEQFDVCRLYVDTAYNIDAGAAVLQQKYAYADSRTPGTPDRSLIENWYLAVRYYNGGGSGANAYADDVVAKLRTPPSTIAPYTTAITLTRPHAVYTGYVTPNPFTASAAGWTFYNSTGTAVVTRGSGSVHAWTSGSGGGSAGPVTIDFASYPTVRRGSTGVHVSALQQLLKDNGFFPYAVVDSFGPLTEDAVVRFQRSRLMYADGVVGPRTWTALLSAGSQPALRIGATGDSVSRLQRALTAALGRSVPIDGSFGPVTDAAVREYQSSRGLYVDGYVGAQTWSALQRGR